MTLHHTRRILVMACSASLILTACGQETSQQATAPIVPIASQPTSTVDLFAPEESTSEEEAPAATVPTLPELADPIANNARSAGLAVLEAHLEGDLEALESMKGSMPIFSVDFLLDATEQTVMYQVASWDSAFVVGSHSGTTLPDYLEHHAPIVTNASTLLTPTITAMLLRDRPGQSVYLFDGTALAERVVEPIVGDAAVFLLIGAGDTWTVQAV